MFSFFNSKPSAPLPMPTSQLFDEQSFYAQFTKDLRNAQSEVIIESPFISKGRVVSLIPVFTELIKRKVKIFIITRPSHESRAYNYFDYSSQGCQSGETL